jgi:hypothetical protein
MKKSTLFISAVLTTFVLAILVGVVSTYQGSLISSQTNTLPATQVAAASTDTPQPTTETASILTPEQAAVLAATILGRTDLLSVETSMLNGVSVYLVTFLSGDQVYVSPEGMILSVVQATPVVAAPVASVANTGNGGDHRRGDGGGGGGGDDNDDDD